MVTEKAEQQEGEVSSHIVSALRKQREHRGSVHFVLLVSIKVGLPTWINPCYKPLLRHGQRFIS